jgi:uncharacterized protein YkwD
MSIADALAVPRPVRQHRVIAHRPGAGPLMSCPVPIGAPARHQADASRAPDPGRRRPGRTAYLWCGLLLVPALIVGGLYLANGPGGSARAGARPSGPGTAAASPAVGSAVAASPAVASAAGASPGPAACGPACAVTPIHVSLARVPAHARGRRPGARPGPSTSSSSPSAPASHPASQPAASGSAASGSASAPASSPASQQGAPADQVLALINQARASAGLPPLTVTSGLDASASAHNLKMAGGCGLTHECPGEPAIGARETAAGVSWTAAGENIGEGGPMPDTAAGMAKMAVTLTQDMLNEQPPDDGHRLNILSSTFTHIGIAVYRDSSGTVWMTQDFSN